MSNRKYRKYITWQNYIVVTWFIGKFPDLYSAAPIPGQDRFLVLANSSPPAGSQHSGRRRRKRGEWRRRGREKVADVALRKDMFLFMIQQFVAVSMLLLFVVRNFDLFNYGIATIPHRQSTSLTKTVPKSFNWKLVFLVLCLKLYAWVWKKDFVKKQFLAQNLEINMPPRMPHKQGCAPRPTPPRRKGARVFITRS